MGGKSFPWLAIAAAVALAGCGRKDDEKALTPLVGVGDNIYCVTDADEQALLARAREDAMAAWILIHHYQRCEVDTDRAAHLLTIQMNRGQDAMLKSLADFNARIEMGQKLKAKG